MEEQQKKWRESLSKVNIWLCVSTTIIEILVSIIMFFAGAIDMPLKKYIIIYIVMPTIFYWSVLGFMFSVFHNKECQQKPHILNRTVLSVMVLNMSAVAWIHYIYPATFLLSVIPLFLSYGFANKQLTRHTSGMAVMGIIFATVHKYVHNMVFNIEDDLIISNSLLCVSIVVALGFIVASLAEKERLDSIALFEAKREAEIANEAKTAFLANMSHEIRTPINAVIGLDEMIMRENIGGAVSEYAYDIKTAAETLLNTVNTILDLTKIESGKMELTYAEYNIKELIHDVVSVIGIRAKDKGLQIIVDVDETLPRLMKGDDIHIKQIITNLITNAVKYTEQGSVTLKVFGHKSGEGEEIEVLVKDTGIGIRDEDKPKLFSRFERIDLSRNRNVEGTGLGLTITVQLLRMMGSMLKFESVYNQGSTFHFTLYQDVVDASPVGKFSYHVEESKTQSDYKPVFKASSAKVMVVDDNAINLKVFKHLLKATKVQIDLAHSGKEAVELSKKGAYDIIFMDHMMPEMDGIEAMHIIRDDDSNENKNVVMVALTANAVVGARETYLEEGFNSFLSKPIDAIKLEELILSFLPKEKIEEQ